MKLIRDIGIDLGTANVLCYVEGRGIVLREPSVVAVDKNTGKVLQVGAAARNMLGRTPGNIVAVRPLRDGVISDYEMTEKMLEQFLKKINKFTLVKPRVIVSVPSGITEVEERAVIQAAMEAGARRVYLIEEPFAAALGAKLAISGPEGHMVVDIGGGTTDIAVLSLNGIATSSSIKVAGDTFDEAVAAYMRKHYGMLIGLNTAEEVKITIGCVYPRPQELSMLVKGRDAKTGLPNEVTISSTEMLDAFKRPARQIVDEVLAPGGVPRQPVHSEVDPPVLRGHAAGDQIVGIKDHGRRLRDTPGQDIRNVAGVCVAHDGVPCQIGDHRIVRLHIGEDADAGPLIHLQHCHVIGLGPPQQVAAPQQRRGDAGPETALRDKPVRRRVEKHPRVSLLCLYR